MQSTEIRDYVFRYLHSHQSRIIERSPGHVQVKLPPELDKDLTNRTYYWSFVERTGVEPETMTLTLIFDPEQVPDGVKGEEVRFGSSRLHQIFNSAQKRGRYVRLYEHISTLHTSPRESVPFTPWLGLNVKIEYLCDQKRDRLVTYGLNLCSGEIIEDFYDRLVNLSLTPKQPNNTHMIRPVVQLDEAIHMLESDLRQKLLHESHDWAVEAQMRLDEELALIESFYDGSSQREASSADKKNEEENRGLLAEKEQRLKETYWQFNPRIRISTINAGLFYLVGRAR